jgi:hypothetical protein
VSKFIFTFKHLSNTNNNFTKRLNHEIKRNHEMTERELLRKRVEIVIPQMKKSEIVNHFQKEGSPQRTMYNTINHLHNVE